MLNFTHTMMGKLIIQRIQLSKMQLDTEKCELKEKKEAEGIYPLLLF